MEEFKIFISLAAISVSIWNFRRISNLDNKKEYKERQFLYQECLDEAKTLLDKIESELTQIQIAQSEIRNRSSPYLNTKGAERGFTAVLVHVREIEKAKNDTIELFNNLSEIISLEAKPAFDKCSSIRESLKEMYIKTLSSIGKAKFQVAELSQTEQRSERT